MTVAHAEAIINDPMPIKEIYAALLTEDEIEKCKQFKDVVTIRDYKLTHAKKLYHAIMSVVDPSCQYLVKLDKQKRFMKSIAEKKIKAKFGLSHIKYHGTRNKVTSLLLSSEFEGDDNTPHRAKMVAMHRAFAKHYPKTWNWNDECSKTIPDKCNLKEASS